MAKYKKRIIWIIVLLLILAFVGYGFYKSRQPKIQYTTATAEKGNLYQTVSVTGELKSVSESDLSFLSSGAVADVYFKIGDIVNSGDKLATLDPSTLKEQLRQAQAELQAQKNTLEAMKRKPSIYSYFQKETQAEIIRKAEQAVAAIKRQFDELNIFSPISGTIIRRDIDPGENATINSPVISVADINNLEIESNVPESDISKIKVGQSASVTFDAFTSEEKFDVAVTEIEPAATVIQDVVYYKVKLKLANLDQRLKVGMSNDIDIHTAEKDNIVIIPLRAVKTDGGRKYVEILKDEKNNIVDQVTVATGLEGDDGLVEVVSGLNGGEKVITLTK
jgi:RND family efflux transporter MFP subunit